MSGSKFLKKYHDIACQNLLSCSNNYGMTEPQKGKEKEWEEYQAEIEYLESLMSAIERIGGLFPAIDKYVLIQLLKEYINDDDQCGGDCMTCDLSEPCEKLRVGVKKIFNMGIIQDLIESQHSQIMS